MPSKVELERAGVLAAVRIDEEIAAALDDAGVEREADAFRRQELQLEIDGAGVALVCCQAG